MQVLILGIGDAFTRRYFGSSSLVQGPEGLLLIDCPDLIHRALRVASALSGWVVEAPDIDDLIITHLHGDHCNGLESFGFYRAIQRKDDPEQAIPRLHCTQPVADRLWERLAPAMDGTHANPDAPRSLADFYDVRILDPDEQATVAGLTVRCRYTGHPVPTIGLKLIDGQNTFAWSGDTPFEQAHVDWLAGANVIVHESNQGPPHTPIEDLNALPQSVRKKMRLIHLPDDYDARASDIKPLEEGELIEV